MNNGIDWEWKKPWRFTGSEKSNSGLVRTSFDASHGRLGQRQSLVCDCQRTPATQLVAGGVYGQVITSP
jgi:hypothetical protein